MHGESFFTGKSVFKFNYFKSLSIYMAEPLPVTQHRKSADPALVIGAI